MFLTEEIVFYIGTQINENERTLSQQQIYFEKTCLQFHEQNLRHVRLSVR